MTDIRLRDNAHAGVLAYHPFWLKLALEVDVGDDAARLRPATADESDEDSAAHAELVAFVKHRFFADPELSKNYQSVPGVENGLHKDGYVVALRALVLKRVLLLALVLDRAVQSQYKPIGCPPLFRVQRRSDDAAAAVLLKRSSDVVVQCLSESVAGSGDVLRHLKVNFKYTLSHEQTSIMEANFAVSNVATDLRDGMRLCKLVDALASPTPTRNGWREVPRGQACPPAAQRQSRSGVVQGVRKFCRLTHEQRGSLRTGDCRWASRDDACCAVVNLRRAPGQSPRVHA